MLPEYLQYAIEHEKGCIKLREHQIEGYNKRIKLMESGMDYFEALKKVPPITAGSFNIKFEKGKYFDLKNEHTRTKNVRKSQRKKSESGA